jgi:hypothetical protein
MPRQLEIGPHKVRIPGFETLDAVKSPLVDHVADCRHLPFPRDTFDLVYASHVIEHIEWGQVQETLVDWVRVIKPDGWLEVHTVDAYRIMRALIELEDTGEWTGPNPHWRSAQTGGDPYLFAVGRLMNYPKDGNVLQHHRALITPKFLRRCFEAAGLVDLAPLTREDMRGSRHIEWINLGLKGRKPC